MVEAVSAWFWPVHGRTALPPVRQLMEVFAIRMCTAYPDLFLTAVMKVSGWVGGAIARIPQPGRRVDADVVELPYHFLILFVL